MRSIKHYEAKPPTNLSSEVIDLENVLATTKEEEWITKKKVELTTKKQIETRVKRQVVLEDGKVVEDSGPIVTTNTTEDTEKQEHQQTEHRQIGNDEDNETTEGWIAVPNSAGIMKKIKENKVKSREETEERLEMENVQHLGDITDDAYLKAIQSQRKDLRLALRQASGELLDATLPLPSSNGRVISHSLKNRKTVDKEDTKHVSQVQNDGRLITESRTITEREEVNNAAEPDDGESGEEDYETRNRSSQRYKKTKEQDLVQYVADGVKVGEQVRFEAESVECDRQGRAAGGGGGDLKILVEPLEWESLSERVRKMRKEKQLKIDEADRTDALTKKPLNFDQEEQTRKVETSKWLEHHFGSESRSSKSCSDDDNDGDGDDDDDGDARAKTSTSSFINVTMKSTKSARPRSPVVTTTATATAASLANATPTRYELSDETDNTSPKNVYEIQTGSIKKVAASSLYSDRQCRPCSPFRPIADKAANLLNSKFNATSQPQPQSQSRLDDASSPSPPSGYISKSQSYSPPLYATVQQKIHHHHQATTTENTSCDRQATFVDANVPAPAARLSTASPPPSLSEQQQQQQQYRFKNNYSNGIITPELWPRKKSTAIVGSNVLSKNNFWSRSERRLTDISDSDVQKEPDPDYTPRLRKKVSSTPDVRSSPPPPSSSLSLPRKKIYQKTRFAADMPIVKRSKSTNRTERKSGFGETFRKIIGKFHHGNKEAVEKNANANANTNPNTNKNGTSFSSTISKNYGNGGGGGGGGGYYQTFGNVDNHIDATTSANDSSAVEDVGENATTAIAASEKKSGRESPLPKQAAKRFYSSTAAAAAAATAEDSSNNTNSVVSKKRVTTTPPPASLVRRSSTLTAATSKTNANANANANANTNANSNGDTVSYASQTLDRNYRVKKKQQQDDIRSMFKRRSPVQKYYLGEDPFGGSIYGKEKEYNAAAAAAAAKAAADDVSGAKPFRRKHKHANTINDEEKKSVRSHILNGMNNIFGGRLARSISNKLPNSDSSQKSKKVHIDYTNRGGIQTLPRKSKKQVYINDPSSDQENLHPRKSLNRNSHSGSMINVSVINGGGGGSGSRTLAYKTFAADIQGPEKPARTYRTSLLRSKSFNVQLGPYGYGRSTPPPPSQPSYSSSLAFKSNPQLHKLEESQAPLKSPGIVTSISRSTRDLSKSIDDHDDSYLGAANYSKINGYTSSYDDVHNSSSSSSSRRRVFLKGLKNRAPELYKTLHEDDELDLRSSRKTSPSSTLYRERDRPKHRHLEYSNSFHSGGGGGGGGGGSLPLYRKPTVSFEADTRRSPAAIIGHSKSDGGGSDDYSETVRITSKSNDPIRPSVTNTVQSFSKKTIPSKDGRVETIESSETTKVTKSHYSGNGDADSDRDNDKNATSTAAAAAGGSRYTSRKNGSVVIQVRNDRK